MSTNMSMLVEIKQKIDSLELYQKLSPYGANVLDMGEKTVVHVQVDLTDEKLEQIINICQSYGDCDVSINKI